MITEIGLAAGDIWHYLDEHQKEATLSDIQKAVDRSRDVILMSLGWLAREGHIILETGAEYKITLRR
jgi:hypothetical protein